MRRILHAVQRSVSRKKRNLSAALVPLKFENCFKSEVDHRHVSKLKRRHLQIACAFFFDKLVSRSRTTIHRAKIAFKIVDKIITSACDCASSSAVSATRLQSVCSLLRLLARRHSRRRIVPQQRADRTGGSLCADDLSFLRVLRDTNARERSCACLRLFERRDRTGNAQSSIVSCRV